MKESAEKLEIEIGEPREADAREIEEVLYKTWLATYPNAEHGITTDDIEALFESHFSDEYLAERAQYLNNMPPHMQVLVARVNGKVVAVCNVGKSEKINKLILIYTLPEYQELGIGHKLWQASQPFLSPSLETIVHVATYNKKAIAFYEKQGFVDSGKRLKNERFRMKSGAIIPEMEMVLKPQ